MRSAEENSSLNPNLTDPARRDLPEGMVVAPRWAAILGSLMLGVLYFFLPAKLRLGPAWLLLAIEIVALCPAIIARLFGRRLPHFTTRLLTLLTLGVVTAALAIGVLLLIVTLPADKHAQVLFSSAIVLWLFNILVFSLWYWEVDGGGPVKRHQAGHKAVDWQFPQQIGGNDGSWAPHYLDYLFVAFTTATALSPTDTMPLTRRIKALMMVQALIAMSLIVIVAARAINML
ncbi:hypothetical protein KSD_88690 [Ktedonobacter sp. SOSP1-85]|uniref:DUF1345 domain-containing protein n=1 Tax=Ktedonobacter sp. SOSP1-85 TaxID=2778367 RepID=UPI0019168FF8|nr:DUF1345 domain-containing protein [Ktedonobacter sp. SOSP1-85]GHO81098.1 hypothetical protein KSD_88690 [Ktedonobacter sp. SOSP1-85]